MRLNHMTDLPGRIKLFYKLPCLFSLALILLSGCDKFEGDQTVPAYLQIDSIGFVSDNDLQGTDNQNFIDAWVYVDDDLVGGFELPAIIPVLSEGEHKLEIRPGILLNGISDTRAPYPCIEPIIFESYNFEKDNIVKAYGNTSYYSNAEFVWMEDFEDASLTIKRSQNSDTGIVRTNAPGFFADEFSQFSGISYLNTNAPYLQLVSDDGNNQGFIFDRGDFIFLEMNYRANSPIVVGLYIKLTDSTIEERSFLIVNPTDDWKKIYVNFTPIVNETINAVSYTVYLESYLLDGSTEGFIMLDNIKLVTRPNL
jgi:hypothetical protein